MTRGGFYQWLDKPQSDREIEGRRLLGLIRDSYDASGGVYGTRRVFGDLCEAGEVCGKHRVEKIMHAQKIKAIRGYKAPRRIVGRPSKIARTLKSIGPGRKLKLPKRRCAKRSERHRLSPRGWKRLCEATLRSKLDGLTAAEVSLVRGELGFY